MRIQAWKPNLTKDLQGALKPCLFQVPAQNYLSCQALRSHTRVSHPIVPFCCPKDFWLVLPPRPFLFEKVSPLVTQDALALVTEGITGMLHHARVLALELP